MTYNKELAGRVHHVLSAEPELVEKKMFGGVGYLLFGNMACGVNGDDLIVRVGLDNYMDALSFPHTREFDMTGRPMRGWVVVTSEGIESETALAEWVQRGVEFALTLPPK